MQNYVTLQYNELYKVLTKLSEDKTIGSIDDFNDYLSPLLLLNGRAQMIVTNFLPMISGRFNTIPRALRFYLSNNECYFLLDEFIKLVLNYKNIKLVESSDIHFWEDLHKIKYVMTFLDIDRLISIYNEAYYKYTRASEPKIFNCPITYLK